MAVRAPFGEDTLQFRDRVGTAPSPVGRGPTEVEAPEADIQRFAPTGGIGHCCVKAR